MREFSSEEFSYHAFSKRVKALRREFDVSPLPVFLFAVIRLPEICCKLELGIAIFAFSFRVEVEPREVISDELLVKELEALNSLSLVPVSEIADVPQVTSVDGLLFQEKRWNSDGLALR